MTKKHKWTENEDIITFYLLRYGEDEKINKSSLLEYMGEKDDKLNSIEKINLPTVDFPVSLSPAITESPLIFISAESIIPIFFISMANIRVLFQEDFKFKIVVGVLSINYAKIYLLSLKY